MRKPKELTEINRNKPPKEFTCLGLHFKLRHDYEKGWNPEYLAYFAEFHSVRLTAYSDGYYRVDGRPFGGSSWVSTVESKSFTTAIRKALAALELEAQKDVARATKRYEELAEKLPKYRASLVALAAIVKASNRRAKPSTKTPSKKKVSK